ncbi:hypothetical protein CR513_25304, partial [Mucuna pruriens]
MKAVEHDELRWQITTMKVAVEKSGGVAREMFNVQAFWGQSFKVVVEPFDGTQDSHAHLKVFQTQMYISGGNDSLSCKLFSDTLTGVAMHWLATLRALSIQSFDDLAASFFSQFAMNKVKRLEVANLFDIRQEKDESLKGNLPSSIMSRFERRGIGDVLTVQARVDATPLPIITFSKKDMRYEPPRQDEPMVVSMITTEYKVEKGSSANILYWSTYRKLGLSAASLEECSGTLYGFAGEQVTIMRVIELETTFGEGNHVHSIPVLYTMVDVNVSYNIIMGRPTLNKL